MTVTRLCCSKTEAVAIQLPGAFVKQPIAQLTPDGNYTNKYIQGFISAKWDLQYKRKKPYLLKLILDESPTGSIRNSAIGVYCFGAVARDLDQTLRGNLLVISGFVVERVTRARAGHPCQVCVDKARGDVQIWIVEIQGPVRVVCDRVTQAPLPRNPEPPKKKVKPPPSYEYTTIDKVQPTSCMNIYGVVKFFKAPYRTRGTDFCQIMSVVDETCDNLTKLKCLFFFRPPAEIPPVKLGSIVRFHRLKVINHNDEPQGNNSPGFSWLVFNGEEGASLQPKASSPNFTLTESDKEKVVALRKWAAGVDALKKSVQRSTLADLSPGNYADVVVQVVSTCIIDPGVCLLLKVWDGTKLLYPVREIPSSGTDFEPIVNEMLGVVAQGFIYDVCLFDDHSLKGRDIWSSTTVAHLHIGRGYKTPHTSVWYMWQSMPDTRQRSVVGLSREVCFPPPINTGHSRPGDFIELRNLHAAVYRNAETRDEYNALQTVELVLHRGSSYGRGAFKCRPGSKEVVDISKKLDAIAEKVRRTAVNRPRNVSVDETDGTSAAPCERPNSGDVQITDVLVPNQNGQSGSGENIQKQNNDAESAQSDAIENRLSRLKRQRLSETVEQVKALSPPKKACTTSAERALNVPTSPELQLSCDPVDTPVQPVETVQERNRCMVDTATVLTDHQHIKCCHLSEVIQHKVPYKFRVMAKMVDYRPRVERPEQLVKVYCPVCHFVDCPGVSGDFTIRSPTCPQCSWGKRSRRSHGLPLMEFTFLIKFCLDDGKNSIIVNLWKEDATEFFRGIKPEDALKDPSSFTTIKNDLKALQGTEACRPWLECSIKSYSGQSGPCYQMFNTTLA